MPSTSALRAMIAATVFGHCRSNSAALLAPRQSADAPPTPNVQPLNVLKKLRRFIAATLSDPPTGVGAAGRAFSAAKPGTAPPNEPIGRSRYALPLAALPAHVYVRTPVI